MSPSDRPTSEYELFARARLPHKLVLRMVTAAALLGLARCAATPMVTAPPLPTTMPASSVTDCQRLKKLGGSRPMCLQRRWINNQCVVLNITNGCNCFEGEQGTCPDGTVVTCVANSDSDCHWPACPTG